MLSVNTFSPRSGQSEIHIPVSRETASDIRSLPQKKPSLLPLEAMRITFAQAGSLLRRRHYPFRPYPHPFSLSLTSSFAQCLSSTLATKKPSSNTPPTNQPSVVSDSKDPDYLSNVANDEHAPPPLSRPLGQPQPPQPGENTGVDPRSWRERRDDFWDYDKHLARRKQLYVFVPIHYIPFQPPCPGGLADNPNYQLSDGHI